MSRQGVQMRFGCMSACWTSVSKPYGTGHATGWSQGSILSTVLHMPSEIERRVVALEHACAHARY